MNQFYITELGHPVGPFSIPEIQKKLQDKKITLSEYIYHPQLQEWQPLISTTLIEEKWRTQYPLHTSTSKSSVARSVKNSPDPLSSNQNLDWFIFKDNQQQGPFPYSEMIRLLQNRKLLDSDYVWSQNLATWTKVFECSDFAPEKIRALMQSSDFNNGTVFFRRQFPRVEVRASVFVHNNKKIWKAHTYEVSAGGCGLVIESELMQVGDKVILHFTPSTEKADFPLPSFNALCTIVSKKLDPKNNQIFRYGLRFEALNQDIQVTIQHMSERAA